MKGPGVLRRLLGRSRVELLGAEGESAAVQDPMLDFADIQGFVLRAYRMPMVRHFLLTVGMPAEARRLLGRLVSGDESDAPQITTAEDWHVGFAPGPGDNPADPPRRKPDYCLNVGITWPGLVALEIEATRPNALVQVVRRVRRRSRAAGGIGRRHRSKRATELDRRFWTGSDHVLVTLHAISPEAMTSYSDRLRPVRRRAMRFERSGARTGWRLWRCMMASPCLLPRFTLVTPTVSARPPFAAVRNSITPDHQQPCEPWLFVLRDDAENYFVPEPRELGLNGSFAVFKMIETDVVGFEDFLQSNRGQDRPRTAGRQDVRTLAQRRSSCVVAGHG